MDRVIEPEQNDSEGEIKVEKSNGPIDIWGEYLENLLSDRELEVNKNSDNEEEDTNGTTMRGVTIVT